MAPYVTVDMICEQFTWRVIFLLKLFNFKMQKDVKVSSISLEKLQHLQKKKKRKEIVT